MSTLTKPKIGDYYVSSWGYDQTNVDFYKVVGLTPKSVKIQQVGSRTVNDNGGPVVYKVPTDEPVTRWVYDETGERVLAEAPVLTRRLRDDTYNGYITINTYASASPWDGKPEYATGAGWGR